MIFASLSFIFLILPVFLTLDVLIRFAFAKCIQIKIAKARVYSWFTKYTICDILTIKTSCDWRNTLLLIISLLFYIWGEAFNVFLLLAIGIINYYAGNYILKSRRPKFVISAIIILDMVILVGFKYFFWILSFILPSSATYAITLPLGISFFTFHAISYVVDIYRNDIKPATNALDFLTYFCMFPHLVAGPIVRYSQIEKDISSRGPNRELFSFGVYRFLVGLNKKVIIANSVATIADTAFSLSASGHLGFGDAWLGIAAYTIQIYFDFSGYSDMAIGLAAMAGFHFGENFNRPYSSASIREFWRRWHISLSSWLRDYIYIPLGGSRKGKAKTYRNLLIIFILCGLWHGADVTFLVWGLWHGGFLVLERLFLGKILSRVSGFVARSYTLLVVMVGWVFFRAENMEAAGDYLLIMFTPSLSPVSLTYFGASMADLLAGVLLCFIPDRFISMPTSKVSGNYSVRIYAIQLILAVLSVAMLVTTARNPFIYFNF